MLANHQSRREINEMGPPWFHTPPANGGVLTCARRRMVFVNPAVNDNGGAVNSARLDVDTTGATGASVQSSFYFSNLAGAGVGYLQLSSSGTSGIQIDPWAVAMSGTAQPCTHILVGQNNAGGAPVNAARLWSFGNTTPALSNPVYDLAYANAGDTAFFLTRRNNAGNAATGPVYDPGHSLFVYYQAYDGANLHTSLNGGNVTTTPFNGGALTLNTSAIGFFPRGGNLPSQPNIAAAYFDAQAVLGADAESLIRYYCRMLRI